MEREISIDIGDQDVVKGDLILPDQAQGLVIFAHGSGSSRHSRRNRQVAQQLNQKKLATLLFDLLTENEEVIDQQTMQLRFDIPLLSKRLEKVIDAMAKDNQTANLPIGCFGASTGAAATLIAASHLPKCVRAIVSRGGRPDLAKQELSGVQAPTLLIVGGLDLPVIEMNKEAYDLLQCEKKLEIVPGASHLFEEPGKLDRVSELASDWFVKKLGE